MDSLHMNFKRQRSSTTVELSREVDYINNLPTDILFQILDKLPFYEALGTSLLCKRWYGLWRHKRRIEIGYQWVQKTGKDVLSSVDHIVHNIFKNNIKSISVSFEYDPSMRKGVQYLLGIDRLMWVEELYVDLDDKNIYREKRRQCPLIRIPKRDWGRHSTIVKKLSLRSLKLEGFPSFRFMCLQQLFFDQVRFPKTLFEQITGTCFDLSLLSLTNCNPSSDLYIIISVRCKLKHLVIREEFGVIGKKTNIYIKCQSLKSIDFLLALPRGGYHIEGILNCSESATFKLDEMHHSRQAMTVVDDLGIAGNFVPNFRGLLMRLKTAKVLTLSSWCIQVLSIEAMQLHRPPIFDATHLVLRTGLTRWEFLGICHMLLGCCKLNRLVIVMSSPAELNFGSMEKRHFLEDNGPCDNVLQDLVVVEFRNYAGDYTWEGDSFQASSFFSGFEFGSLLLWNLKTYAKNLRKFVFSAKRQVYETDGTHFGSFDLYRQYKNVNLPPRLSIL